MRILEGERVKRHFGGLAAVAHVDFRIDQVEIVGLIRPNGALNEQGVTILLVEQNIRHAFEITDRAYLLDNGRVVLEGARERFLQNRHVKKACLGL